MGNIGGIPAPGYRYRKMSHTSVSVSEAHSSWFLRFRVRGLGLQSGNAGYRSNKKKSRHKHKQFYGI